MKRWPKLQLAIIILWGLALLSAIASFVLSYDLKSRVLSSIMCLSFAIAFYGDLRKYLHYRRTET